MSKRLLPLNAVLIGASIGLVAYIGWHLFTPIRDVALTRRATPPAATPTAPGRPTPDGSVGAYGAIASRNLFSPDRTEAPVAASAASALAAVRKPHLHPIIR